MDFVLFFFSCMKLVALILTVDVVTVEFRSRLTDSLCVR